MATPFTLIQLVGDYRIAKIGCRLRVTSEDKVEVKVKSGEL
jgi:hypothetical protein